MTTALALLLAAPLLALAALKMWCYPIGKGKPQTVPEAAVRVLLHLARWLAALSDALQDGVIAYREHVRERPIESRVEQYRASFQLEEPEEEPVTAVVKRGWYIGGASAE